MKSFLFTNAFFEEELSTFSSLSLMQFLQRHPLYTQLQYLSCFLASSSEVPLLSHPPDSSYLTHLKNLGLAPSSFALLTDAPTPSSLSSWGFSKSLSKWAQEKNCTYNTPALEVIYKIQSKEFSFLSFPQPKHSQKIASSEELTFWWESFSGPKVLKTLFGSSGRGHFLSSGETLDLPKALSFLLNIKNYPQRLSRNPGLQEFLISARSGTFLRMALLHIWEQLFAKTLLVVHTKKASQEKKNFYFTNTLRILKNTFYMRKKL